MDSMQPPQRPPTFSGDSQSDRAQPDTPQPGAMQHDVAPVVDQFGSDPTIDDSGPSSRGFLVVIGVLLVCGLGWFAATKAFGGSQDELAGSAPAATIAQQLDAGADQEPRTTAADAQPTTPISESAPTTTEGAPAATEAPESTSPVTQQDLASIAVTVEGEPLPESTVSGLSFDPASDSGIGQLAPLFTGPQFGGELLTVGESGAPKVILFVAHWCPHCQREVPQIMQLVAEGHLPANIEIYAVSTAVDETRGNYPPQAWLETEEWSFPVVQDDASYQLFNAFGGTGFPYAVYLDGENRLVGRGTGSMEPAGTIAVWDYLADS